MASKNKLSRNTIGGRFGSMCIVGLNSVEVLTPDDDQPAVGENWQDIVTEASKKSMALCFFAPTEADGVAVDPFEYLSGAEAQDLAEATIKTKQALTGMPLLDLYRCREEKANVVNILVAADVIFHWDNAGAYILPTSKQNWLRDLQQILKHYPRKVSAKVYTNWPHERLNELPNVTAIPAREMPLLPDVWINMPTFQDKYGNMILAMGILSAAAVYGGIWWQNNTLDELSQNIRGIERKMPNVSNIAGMGSMLSEQYEQMQYKEFIPWMLKDIGLAIQSSGMKVDQFELKKPDLTKPTRVFIATIEAQRDEYKGWLQEEPIAKGVLSHSVAMSAIRKPPGGKFKLEGYIDMPSFSSKLQEFKKKAEQLGEEFEE